MPFELSPLHLVYLLTALAVGLLAEGLYLLFFSSRSYRKNVNRRLRMSEDNPDRENMMVQLRRERGLSAAGDYSLRIVALNKLILQSGLTIGIGKLALYSCVFSIIVFGVLLLTRGGLIEALIVAVFCCTLLPLLVLRYLRNKRHKAFGTQFADALDMIVRSLRAGHPVPIAINLVAREMPDPIGSEFGLACDEVTYGADLETGMRNLYYRVGQDDLPLFVTAVAIQTSTGGNLGEILAGLARVIRERTKMRRKVKALASEGRASAMILSSLPFILFLLVYMAAPNFYGDVWHENMTKIGLGIAGAWMMVGNFIMYRMVNFRI